MGKVYTILLLFGALLSGIPVCGQTDSTLAALEQLPEKYFSTISTKVDRYSSRVSSKTIKTLTKLARWENKVKNTLQKVNPQAAAKLFANKDKTFGGLLEKIESGKEFNLRIQKTYDEYRDRLGTNIKYLQQNKDKLDKKSCSQLSSISQKIAALDSTAQTSEAIEQFIRERKKQLIAETIKILGKNKYLKKINSEAYYYVNTIKNYKENFADPTKVEKEILKALSKLPAFNDFLNQLNAGVNPFSSGGNSLSLLSSGSPAPLNGLMNRVNVQQAITQQVGGTDNLTSVSRKIKESFNDYQQSVEKIKANNNSIEKDSLGFRPNNQKSKSFRERLTYLFNFQFGSTSNYYPSTCNMGFTLSYSISDKSSAGLGLSYILGMGKGWKDIKFTSEGIGIRSFYEIKTGKNFYLRTGAELNYVTPVKDVNSFYKLDNWQKSALAGLSKKIQLRGKISGSIQIMYDFLYKSHLPISQPFIYRIGYSF